MRAVLAVVLGCLVAGGAVAGPRRHHVRHAGGEKPVDVGPNTPDANKAYQGGGVVLQGAPGAPAPVPQATPPGQVPVGSVPQ